MSDLPFERLFSLGAFEGLRAIRRQLSIVPEDSLLRIVELLTELDPQARGLDFEAALVLDRFVAASAVLDGRLFYRSCIQQLLIAQGAPWARTVLLGRKRLFGQLSRDEMQCFRAAGLDESPAPSDVIEWWDELARKIRTTVDGAKSDRSRDAERLTLEHETSRLRAIGIDRDPVWVAIEDNTAGYDVLSYDVGIVEPVNRLIEVKSTITSPLRFFLTRNEWDTATKFITAYQFHIWDLAASPPRLFERTVSEIAPHVPSDNECGKWSRAEIPVM